MGFGAGAVLMADVLAAGCAADRTRARAAEIEQGRTLYAANGCGTCHGATGRGDGPMAKTLSPPPRDFRDASAFKNGSEATTVANTIATGLTRDGGQMQPYFHLSGRERLLLARFVISLRESGTVLVTPTAAQSPLKVTSAWIREPIGGRAVASAYGTVENPGTADVRIVGASADVAGSVEIHEMARAGDIMKMAPVKTITVPAHGTMEFAPGGTHLMLFDVKRLLKDGETATLTFTTSDGGQVAAVAAVKKVQMQE